MFVLWLFYGVTRVMFGAVKQCAFLCCVYVLLRVAILQARSFFFAADSSDFQRNHPGGALGAKQVRLRMSVLVWSLRRSTTDVLCLLR